MAIFEGHTPLLPLTPPEAHQRECGVNGAFCSWPNVLTGGRDMSRPYRISLIAMWLV